MALISALLVLMVLMSLVLVTIAAAVHSNDATQADRHKETAFAAATAGVDKTVQCLQGLPLASPVATCNVAVSSLSQLSDANVNTGQYAVTIDDLSPGLATKTVVIHSTGWGPTNSSLSATRSARRIAARFTLTPNGGFFDAIFAGGTAPQGSVTLKNASTITGSVYAKTMDIQKNANSVLDLRVVGDITMKNNDVFRSAWAGGSLTLGHNAVVQTNAQACGAGGSPGNATIGAGSSIGGNLRYAGILSNSGSVGSLTPGGCSPPASLNLPAFTYNQANYPGWTIASFVTVAAANSCLASASGSAVSQIAACGVALGDADGTVGKNESGTLIYVNAPVCTVPVSFNGASLSGNFTIVSNCQLAVNGSLVKSPLAVGLKQAVFISTSTTGTDDLTGTPNCSDPSIGVLLYTTGALATTNALSIAAGSLYGASVTGKNALTLTSSNDLANNPPPGFTFDTSVATKYIPLLKLWQES
ncbi:MAG: hypothetical protein NVSMB57_01190 [Actinomycetota bacterium]